MQDAQLAGERSSNDSSNKALIRQLKNQLEDAEFARTAALKAKQNVELELGDVQTQLDDTIRAKADTEDRLFKLSRYAKRFASLTESVLESFLSCREKADLGTHLEENEEELQETLRKYKASVSQLGVDRITINDQTATINDLEVS